MSSRYYHYLLYLLFLIAAPTLHAQEVLNGIAKSRASLFDGRLYNEQDAISGYYKHIAVEQLDKQSFIVRFILMDLELDPYAEFDLEFAGNSQILELAVVDDLVGIVYYEDFYKKMIVYNISEGKIESKRQFEKSLLAQNSLYYNSSGSLVPQINEKNIYIKSFPNQTFTLVYYHYANQYLYHYNNKNKKFTSIYDDKKGKVILYLSHNDRYTYWRVDEEHGRGISRVDVLDIQTGKLVKSITNKDFDKSFIVKSVLNEKNGNITLAGVYNNTNSLKKPHKKTSHGVALIETDATLSIKKQTYIPWNSFSKNQTVSEKGKLTNKYNLYVNHFVKDSDDQIYMAASQIKVNFQPLKFFPFYGAFLNSHMGKIGDLSLYQINKEKVIKEYNLEFDGLQFVNAKFFNKRNRYLYMFILNNNKRLHYNDLYFEPVSNTVVFQGIKNFVYLDPSKSLITHKYLYITPEGNKTYQFKKDSENLQLHTSKFGKIVLLQKGVGRQNLIIENIL